MGWQLGILESAEDLEITQSEVTSMFSGVFEAGIQGMVIVGVMSMCVRGMYDIIGSKKLAKQEKEVLGMVEKIW